VIARFRCRTMHQITILFCFSERDHSTRLKLFRNAAGEDARGFLVRTADGSAVRTFVITFVRRRHGEIMARTRDRSSCIFNLLALINSQQDSFARSACRTCFKPRESPRRRRRRRNHSSPPLPLHHRSHRKHRAAARPHHRTQPSRRYAHTHTHTRALFS
jgi:hypothetical protein